MNKEAIERTKARCKKECAIGGVKPVRLYHHGEEIILDGKKYIVSGFNNSATLNPKEIGLIVPRSDYIPEPDMWIPLSKKELIAVPVILCIVGISIYWWLS